MKIVLNAQEAKTIKAVASIVPARMPSFACNFVHLKLSADATRGVVEASRPYIDGMFVSAHFRTAIAQLTEHIFIPASVAKKLKKGSVIETTRMHTIVDNVATPNAIVLEDFPRQPDSKPVFVYRFDSQYVPSFVKTAMSAHIGETHPVLETVCHRQDVMVATDGLRLCQTLHGSTCEDFENDVLVPATVAAPLQKLFGASKTLDMIVTEKHICYASYDDDTYMHVRRPDVGQYPDVTRIIPQVHESYAIIEEVKLTADMLKECAKLVKKDGQPACDVEFKDGELHIEGISDGGIIYKNVSPALTPDGAFTVRAQPKYIYDALLQCGDEAMIRFQRATTPLVIESKDRGTIAVLSPIIRKANC